MSSTTFWSNLHLPDNSKYWRDIQPLLELVHCLLDKVGLRRGVTVSSEGWIWPVVKGYAI